MTEDPGDAEEKEPDAEPALNFSEQAFKLFREMHEREVKRYERTADRAKLIVQMATVMATGFALKLETFMMLAMQANVFWRSWLVATFVAIICALVLSMRAVLIARYSELPPKYLHRKAIDLRKTWDAPDAAAQLLQEASACYLQCIEETAYWQDRASQASRWAGGALIAGACALVPFIVRTIFLPSAAA